MTNKRLTQNVARMSTTYCNELDSKVSLVPDSNVQPNVPCPRGAHHVKHRHRTQEHAIDWAKVHLTSDRLTKLLMIHGSYLNGCCNQSSVGYYIYWLMVDGSCYS